MPCPSFSTPAADCRTGSKLRLIKGSVCATCYAHNRGNYCRPNVKSLRVYNLDGIRANKTAAHWKAWGDAMVATIGESKHGGYFRWHDSGDVQSLAHLTAIAYIAGKLTHIDFWLPTKEKGFLLAFIRAHGNFPVNLTVRLSAPMVDGTAPKAWTLTSTVYTTTPIGTECRAYTQGGECVDCRACWDKTIPNISYPKH